MPKKKTRIAAEVTPMVQFEFQKRTYQIDPDRKKVYNRFVEIETSRAIEIFTNWRQQHA